MNLIIIIIKQKIKGLKGLLYILLPPNSKVLKNSFSTILKTKKVYI